MIPAIFRTEREREAEGRSEGVMAEATRQGLKESAFALGFAGAIAPYRGFIIPRAYGSSIDATGGPQTVLLAFVVFYVTYRAVTRTRFALHLELTAASVGSSRIHQRAHLPGLYEPFAIVSFYALGF